ncbi:MAG: hydroxymethylbilane synthase [Sedimentisphaerales bacterium]|nr:hydroxymethylbilane synthase [Sedimentisphaerales bacterium]
MKTIRVATRSSDLALAQSGQVIDALRDAHPHLEIEVVKVTTKGDQDRTTALWKLPGMGFFTNQVEQALLEDRAEVAIHSYKDMPSRITEGLTIAAIFERRWPEDVLVAHGMIASLDDLPAGAKIGTSSPRRIALLRTVRHDLNIEILRGNVPTRLARVQEGLLDAIILARAGLERLGLSNRISLILDPAIFTPAPAQGALAIQCKDDDIETRELLQAVNHEPTRLAVETERAVLAGLHPGCHAPVGVYAKRETNGILHMTAFLADTEGKTMIRREMRGKTENGQDMAKKIVQQILDAGGDAILQAMETE